MHCTCARMVCFSAEHILTELRQVYMRYEALIHRPFASVEKKNCGAESAVDRDPVRKRLADGV